LLSGCSFKKKTYKNRVVHLKAVETEYRIRPELSPVANAIIRAAEVPVPVRVNAVH
jgi:hypothetical protein